MSVVPGDPGSVSACAATAGAVSRSLAAASEPLAAAVRAVGEGWPGRRSVQARRTGAAVADGAAAVAAEVATVAALLQDHATDLAELGARGRVIEERAAAAGLEVRDGRVVPAPGIRGAADAAAERDRDEVARGLQSDLDLVLAQHRRRRDFALGALRDSTARLGDLSADLRR